MSENESFELSLQPEWQEDARRAYTTILSMGDKVKMISEADAIELLQGAVDIHVHAAPDPEIDVGWDQLGSAIRATDLGMGAVLFKSHTIPTAATAFFVQKSVDEYAAAISKKAANAFGGVTFNYYQGGLNPATVEMCAQSEGENRLAAEP